MTIDKKWLTICVIGLLLRLIVVIFIPSGRQYDHASYRIVREIVHAGGNVYTETTRYNYAPPWMYLLSILPDDVVVSIRVVVSIFDVIAGILIFAIAKTAHLRPYTAMMAYLFNPLFILLAGYYAQIEPILLVPVLGIVLLVLRHHYRSGDPVDAH